MHSRTLALCLSGLLATAAASGALADRDRHDRDDRRWKPREASFNRVSTLANYLNNSPAERGEETVSEIVAATADGTTLVYTDGALEQIGLVDISTPSMPAPLGKADVGGEPTSVDVLGNHIALVAVVTDDTFTAPDGALRVFDISTPTAPALIASLPLDGQPDSMKISPDGRYVVVVIENERDEEICVGGTEDAKPVPEDGPEDPGDISADACEAGGGAVGVIPQNGPGTTIGNPPGFLRIFEITGPNPAVWLRRDVDLTGIADFAPSDPEPEFVDINEHNEAVVSLQENNHIVIVDVPGARVIGDFSAGTVDLKGVDVEDDGVISLTEKLKKVPREPDAVTWIADRGKKGRYHIGTANEGDLFGGSRGFSIFDRKGKVRFDSGTGFEELAVRHGHYPEGRSDNKGSEPESIEFARFGDDDLLFVGSERGSFVAVYELDGRKPRFKQLLPAPLGPEGLLAIPGRGLLVASGEEDDPEFGVRSTLQIYALERGAPAYPQIVSVDRKGKKGPIPWSALSGMVASPWEPDMLLAVWDSFYAESTIFHIDVSRRPATIVDATTIEGGSGNYDPEGIAVAPDGTIWIASEGNASDSRPNRLLQLDGHGHVIAEIGLPPEILACRAASTARGTLGSGFEGVAVLPGFRGYRLAVAQQRGWDYTTPECESLDDDDGGLNARGEPNRTRIWLYDPHSGDWGHIAWELAPLPVNASWVGLSEITQAPFGGYVLIERDNRTGDFAALKTLVQVQRRDAADGLVGASDKRVFDLLPALDATNGWITDKPEGTAITRDGRVFVVTDNDGVDDWSGETWFLELGRYFRLFF